MKRTKLVGPKMVVLMEKEKEEEEDSAIPQSS